MKKENRICKNCDFSKIIKQGKKFHTSTISFYYLRNNEQTYKIGISVSKKVSKLAVDRNKIKRRIVASFNLNKFNYNFNVIVIVKKEILEKSFQDINSEIVKFIKKINERICDEGKK